MGVEEVLQRFVQRSAFHIVELAAVLLRICRERAEVLRAARIDPRWNRVFARARRASADVARDRGTLRGEDAIELCRVARTAISSGAPDVLVARALAEGLDAGAGHLFVDWFYGPDLELEPNTPFPVAESNARNWVRRSTGSPSTRTEPLDRLPHLRLAPLDLRGLRISMRWLDDALAELQYVDRFGLGVVCGPDVFDTFTWERYSIDETGLFFHVRPNEPQRLEASVRAVVQLAAERRVDLLVLPELCLSEEMHARLVAAGSGHVRAGALCRRGQLSHAFRGRARSQRSDVVRRWPSDLDPPEVSPSGPARPVR